MLYFFKNVAWPFGLTFLFNLDSAIEREKEVQKIGVHRKLENFVVTLLVIKIFSGFLGALRTCAYLSDSTAEFRFKELS
ncbi:MAG: hypothetical protein HRU06_18165 [Oceanospirillaceae bacterium]|nr:hypothetical protein [Oceanospirillaceae bacterium]